MITYYILVFLAGVFVGAMVGVILAAMMSANSRDDEIKDTVISILKEKGIDDIDV